MAKDSTIAIMFIVAIAAVTGMAFSATSGDDVELPTGVQEGDDATLTFAATNQMESGTPQVATDLYYVDNSGETPVVIEEDLTSDQRTEVQAAVGDEYDVAAFDSETGEYVYGEVREGQEIQSASNNINLDVNPIASTISYEVMDNGEAQTEITLGNQEVEALDGLEVEVAEAEAGYSPHLVLVEEGQDVDVTLPNYNEMSVPNADSLDHYDRAYAVWSESAEEPLLEGWEDDMTDTVQFEAADDFETRTEADTVEFGVVDARSYLGDDDQFQTGVIDQNEELLGHLETQTLDVNPPE